MSLVKMRTAELIGPALDWAVAKALGWVSYPTDSIEQGDTWHMDPGTAPFGPVMKVANWRPSTNWSQGGPLIAKYRVSLEDIGIGWIATPRCCTSAAGSMTPQASDSLLVAACRAIVCASIGDTVQIPSELIQ